MDTDKCKMCPIIVSVISYTTVTVILKTTKSRSVTVLSALNFDGILKHYLHCAWLCVFVYDNTCLYHEKIRSIPLVHEYPIFDLT